MANDNPYSGKPTYSRDLTSIMRRINALEHQLSIGPSPGYSIAMDFDIMDGRVYVLVRETTTGFRMKIHDATDGAPIDEFAIPFPMIFSDAPNPNDYQEINAQPRMCCGGGHIYMPGTWRHTGDAVGGPYEGGGFWKFSTNGDGAQFYKFPRGEQTRGIVDVQSSSYYLSNGGVPVDDYFYPPDEVDYALSWGSQRVTRNARMQMHYIDGLIYAISVYVQSGGRIEGYQVGTGNTSDSQVTDPPFERNRYRSQLCFATDDGATLAWAATEVREKRGDDRDSKTFTRIPWPEGDTEPVPRPLAYWVPTPFLPTAPSAWFDEMIAQGDSILPSWFGMTSAHSYESEVMLSGPNHDVSLSIWEGAKVYPGGALETYYPSRAGDFGLRNLSNQFAFAQRLSEGRSLDYDNVISPVHSLSSGAMAAHDGYIYFDGGGEEEFDVGAAVPVSNFCRMPADGNEIAQPEIVHKNKLVAFSTGASRYSHAWLYATDGIYLFAVEGENPRQLNRYELLDGSPVDEWPELSPNQIRVIDGYLWLSYPATIGDTGSTQSKIEKRDPATMAVILEFFVGDPMGQTEWFAYQGGGASESLGTPDDGVTIPDLEALVPKQKNSLKCAELIGDMRGALRRLAPFFLAPSGERLQLLGLDDDQNLYRIAMGDRTKYGATGGEILSWTRDINLLAHTSHVTGVYHCIKDHIATALNRPGVGGEWQTYWRGGFESPSVDPESVAEWSAGTRYSVRKTYDIDIGEIDECLTILEGSPLASAPQGGV